jgi:NAD(P)-dependent dehydrogenase (short-subunit alcohol dehydrogenase family)
MDGSPGASVGKGVGVDPRTVIDDLLEVTVVGSFSRIGYVARAALFDWTPPAPGALDGKTVLITGPTSGLGRQAAEEVAALGARVVLVGRSEERLARVRDALVERHGEDRFPIVVADMGSLASIRAATAHVLATESRLDVMIDNAGAILPERTIGPDGIEAMLASLVVGPFTLIGGLLPLLEQTAGARVIAVTSGGQYAQPLDLDDLQNAIEPYSGTRAYARAKRAQVSLIREWSRRLAGSVRFDSMHPGWADTPGVAESLPTFSKVMGPILRTAAEGTDTLIWLAAGGGLGEPGGSLWLDRRRRPFDRVPMTRLSREDRRRLWAAIVDLSRGPDPAPDVGGHD